MEFINSQEISYKFQVDSQKIALLRFLLEGYDNLCLLTTLDKKKGFVRILTAKTQQKYFEEVLEKINHKIKLIPIC